ncbi:MAG: ribokinase [Clostridia bacterium]|nr:ribokinase [Clostridia bacterium]
MCDGNRNLHQVKILNFGSCNVDYVYSLDHIVKAGETESTYRLNTYPGGKGLNQSIAIKRAGSCVYHAGCIGEGGAFLLDILKRDGVDVSFLESVDEKNGHAIIQVCPSGENAIFLYPGSNHMISSRQIDHVLEAFSENDILVLQNEINAPEEIVEKAYRKGMRIVLNPSPYNEKIQGIDFAMLSYLILNEPEIKQISACETVSDALLYFQKAFPRLRVMLTLGGRGCIYQSEGKQIFCPSFRVNAVDTTGAGDTFTGYFVSGIANAQSTEQILRTASCAAALSVTKEGAATSIPYIAEVVAQIDSLEASTENAEK